VHVERFPDFVVLVHAGLVNVSIPL
jgi:hypothetical protein